MEMLPWNLACPCLFSEDGEDDEGEGEDVAGGIQSRCAREKPPTSLSDINLQSWMEEASWNV